MSVLDELRDTLIRVMGYTKEDREWLNAVFDVFEQAHPGLSVCGNCDHSVGMRRMEYGCYCTEGDDAHVWDVHPHQQCQYSPSRWQEVEVYGRENRG